MNTGICPKHLLNYVINPTLKHIGLDSRKSSALIIGTAAKESRLGYYLKQIKGPALGMYQIEPKTHKDVYENFLLFRENNELRAKVDQLSRFSTYDKREHELITNLEYATAIARIIYYRVPYPLPNRDNVEDMAYYWKKYYNTLYGKGTMLEFIHSYEELVEGKINES